MDQKIIEDEWGSWISIETSKHKIMVSAGIRDYESGADFTFEPEEVLEIMRALNEALEDLDYEHRTNYSIRGL